MKQILQVRTKHQILFIFPATFCSTEFQSQLIKYMLIEDQRSNSAWSKYSTLSFIHTSLMYDTLLFESRHFLHTVTSFSCYKLLHPLSFINKKIKPITYSVHNVEVAWQMLSYSQFYCLMSMFWVPMMIAHQSWIIWCFTCTGIARTDGSVKCNVKHLMSFLTHLNRMEAPYCGHFIWHYHKLIYC
jgi:hypothetical protein